jgi:hypothetical protein
MPDSQGMNPLKWSSRMRDELAQFPETAANIREASANLREVSSQLIEVAQVLTRIVRVMEAAGFTEGLERMAQVGRGVDQVKSVLTPPTSTGDLMERLADLESAMYGIGRRILGFGDQGADSPGGRSAGADADDQE